MNCGKVAERLEDYQYGELDPLERSGVATHLGACASCRRLLAELEAEAARYAGYGREVEHRLELAPRLWQGVEARLAEAPPGRLQWRFRREGRRLALAAPAALVVLGGALAALELYHGSLRRGPELRAREEPGGARAGSRAEIREAPASTPVAAIQRAEQDYLDAIGLVAGALDGQRSRLDPELRRALDRNLEVVDETIAATRKVYLAHPGDPELAEYLLTAYARKLEVLQEVTL